MFRPQSHADANAVRQVLAGRRDVFADLVTRYERAVKGIALASCRNVQEAEDLAQEAFLRAFKDLTRLRQPDHFGPWLIQITRNLAVDRARRTAARPLPSALPDSDAFEEDPAANELHRLLREEVMRLAPAFREAILLHYFSGKSAAEIGRLLGISRAAALKRIQRGRQDLSSSLEKHLADAFQDRRGKGALVGAVMAAVATCPLPARAHTA
ncbi:MAG: sigma-70 family RNA polymerase sigma factor, partial [Candidatus Hydrogenedentes bacterium]|nr:sigma-70 family RNA polymerase sigma factor [Candidatus Hydrogenedentota bacterium]